MPTKAQRRRNQQKKTINNQYDMGYNQNEVLKVCSCIANNNFDNCCGKKLDSMVRKFIYENLLFPELDKLPKDIFDDL